MSSFTDADTIRILVATDNHVGYNERDAVRGDDSWRSFDEILRLAKDHDVDMVLLAGDLFHENKPSRKAMYQVMRSLRENCLGDKPCEIEMLSDTSEHFAGAFNHVNYEDPNINVSIPVFSIHGNHDDPSGEGNFAALDLLQASGLLNYYGRTPEADNIHVRPLCLQKGQTKLALYGISNVRDERLFRTFRDGGVTFFRPDMQQDDFFNMMSIHQNHHAYTETGYIPEHFIPEYMDLVVWGHEHECKIDPKTNPERGFKVMQPGSSVATSLDKTEAVPKHVAIVTVTGRDFTSEAIRLKTVRPFMWKEIALRDHEEMCQIAHRSDNRTKITQFLTSQVEELIDRANQAWHDAHEEAGGELDDEEDGPPRPIVRIRVDHTAPPDGGEFNVENPQRFSNRFQERVANVNDVVQYHRKRSGAKAGRNQPDMPEENIMAQITLDSVKVEKLVQEFLTAQALSILPQNSFSNAVGQFVDKDDKHAMEDFLKDSLESQVENLMVDNDDDVNDDKIADLIGARKAQMEDAHEKGERKRKNRQSKRKPRPLNWDSDEDGPWEESIMSVIHENEEVDQANGEELPDDVSVASTSQSVPARGRGSRGGRGGKTTGGTTRKAAAAGKKAPAKAASTRGKKKQPFEEDEEEDNDGDVIMLDDDDDDAESSLFVSQASSKPHASNTRSGTQRSSGSTSTRGRGRGRGGALTSTSGGRQSTISFGSQMTNGTGTSRTAGRTTASRRVQAPSDDEISDDDDAFEPPPAAQRTRTGRR